MEDSCKKAVALAVAGGYVLGRTKKAKLALALGSLVAGRRLGLNPQDLLTQGFKKVTELPQFQELSVEVKGQLLTAARTAATAMANRRIEGLVDSLRDRTEGLRGPGEAKDEDEEREEEEGGRDEEPEEEEPAPSRGKSGAETDRSRKPAPPKSRPSSGRPSRKSSPGGTSRKPATHSGRGR
ncbi:MULTISPECIES: hypothetical protein [Streptomyces]|uniref:hypothetical protein n=1 Tax=Streptomyces TaxID=1883 RepID=UPI0004B0EB91|nr:MULTISPECIES: hypothetical protein [unclassified Streptomyces]MYY15925.1 hypothetical protein [Streptomyces sp. SID4912]SCD29185.1 hypothetical protein GA0115249_100921 [Streptomyces sp. PpalLS-921]SCE05351.1 hypothetical protein GA0115241_1092157 [Streptomyces sp. DpondAA-D4]